MKHVLKTHPQHFRAVWDGSKTFEVRFDDRRYRLHDMLVLREWNPDTEEYTGSIIHASVEYILRDSEYVKEGYVIMGIKVMK